MTSNTVMRMINELTEVASRIKDLAAFMDGCKSTLSRDEALLIIPQVEAMGVYSKMLAARVNLHTRR